MADAKLSVEISAKLDNLSDGLKNAISKVQGFDKDAAKSLRNVDSEIQKLANNFDSGFNKAGNATAKLADQAKKASAVLGGSVTKGADQAGVALTNLGRVAQDAPFGFVGIQNNLNPLLESFQRLRAESGSNGAALKALGQSLIGPAGLGIALSLVSAGVLLYQQYQQRSKKATEEAKKSTDDYAASLDQVTRAQLKGAQNAVAELTQLKILYGVTQNLALSQDQRQRATDELQSKYPAYFKNIKDETILAGGAKTAYDSLAQSILATARARAAEELIGTNTKRQLENSTKFAELEKQRNLENERSAKNLNQIRAGGTGTGAAGLASQAEAAEKRAAEIVKQQNDLLSDSNILRKRNLDLTKSINVEIEKGADITGNVGKDFTPKINTKDAKKDLEAQKEDILFEINSLNAEVAKTYQNATLTGDQDFLGIGAKVDATAIHFERFLTAGQEFRDKVNKILGEDFENGFADIGSAIGNALANGGNVLDAFGASVLSTIGDILVQFGKLTIAAGVASTALGAALKNPLLPGAGFAAIAAGVALVAVGSLVKGFSGKIGGGSSAVSAPSSSGRGAIPQYANGTDFSKGGLALVGERGPELVNLNPGSQVIPNHKLSGLGQSNNITLSGNLSVQMGQLAFELDKYRGKQKRLG